MISKTTTADFEEMVASLQKTADAEAVRTTVGELRKVMMACLLQERLDYTKAATAVEQYIKSWEAGNP